LFHWETLFVVTARDTEDVTFEFITDGVGGDFLRDTLVEEDSAA
jgi:hypothetical protein